MNPDSTLAKRLLQLADTPIGTVPRAEAANELVRELWERRVIQTIVRNHLPSKAQASQIEIDVIQQDAVVTVMQHLKATVTREYLDGRSGQAITIIGGWCQNAITANARAEKISGTAMIVRRQEQWNAAVTQLRAALNREPEKAEIIEHLNARIRPDRDKPFDGRNHVLPELKYDTDESEPGANFGPAVTAGPEEETVMWLSTSQVVRELASIVMRQTGSQEHCNVLKSWAVGVANGEIAPQSIIELSEFLGITRARARAHMSAIKQAVSAYKEALEQSA